MRSARNEDGAAADHHVGTTAYGAATPPVVDAPHFAVGHHRRIHRVGNARNPLPVRRRPVAVVAGSGVHYQRGDATGAEGACAQAMAREVSEIPRRIFAVTGTSSGTLERTTLTMR